MVPTHRAPKQSTGKLFHAKTALAILLPALPLSAFAGGLGMYEVGTADVGLASAGYSARAQDASTVLTNPAGMTKLQGTQVLLGAQALYGDFEFSPSSGTSAALGSNSGHNAVGWTPGGGLFMTHNISPTVTVGFASASTFGLAESYDKSWQGRYYVQETTMIGMSLLPSIAYKATDKLSLGASLNATYGIFKDKVAINNVAAGLADGQLKLDDNVWGFGYNLGMLYDFSPGTRLGVTYNSEVKLDFEAKTKFSGQGPGLDALLKARGLLNAKLGLGVYIPQGVMASMFHQVDDRWAVLGSVGWQNWSKFGKVDVSIEDTSNPTSTTTNLDFKDTWHAAVGAQYRISNPWLMNFGLAYDSKFQDSSKIGPALPSNDAWRFGLGFQNQSQKNFEWGVAAEYVYGGNIDIAKTGSAPVALGGRGNLVGSYDPRIYFLSANASWKF